MPLTDGNNCLLDENTGDVTRQPRKSQTTSFLRQRRGPRSVTDVATYTSSDTNVRTISWRSSDVMILFFITIRTCSHELN